MDTYTAISSLVIFYLFYAPFPVAILFGNIWDLGLHTGKGVQMKGQLNKELESQD